MDVKPNFLDGYELESKFAADAGTSQRTIYRYRNQPDGLPYVEWSGKIYIPVEEARAWLRNRVKRPNPSRRSRQSAA